MAHQSDPPTDADRTPERYDAIVIGAGFAGLYMLYRLRQLGLRARVFEMGEDVGGTWYWNRYPGARCDVESTDYVYSFSDELVQEWDWKERYSAQPDVLAYLRYVADKFDLRSHIDFSTKVDSATFDEQRNRWTVHTDTGRVAEARFCIAAVGCLSAANVPEIPGLERFRGDWYHTGRWPHERVRFEGQRVGVIGTGSSGIQLIPEVAREADHLFVFQRTPSFSVPAQNRPLDPQERERIKARFREHRHKARRSNAGWVVSVMADKGAEVTSPDERERIYRMGWERGGPLFVRATFNNLLVNLEANETASEFVRQRIDEIVKDPEVAEKLKPYSYPIGTKRLCVDTGYYETYNQDNLTLVDLRQEPLERITADGIETRTGHYRLDSIVFATGYDAMTGALLRIDIRGRDGTKLSDVWADGPRTYLGLAVSGFPNLFTITGPQSPSVLTNMVVSIEQHVDWIADCLAHMRERGNEAIEASPGAQEDWVSHVNALGTSTLHRMADSWYMGANIPGKPRVFMPYVGGLWQYTQICRSVADAGYQGFHFREGPGRLQDLLAGHTAAPDLRP